MTSAVRRPALSVSTIVVSLIALATLPSGERLRAQSPPEADLRRVIDVQVKPDKVAEWTRLHREEMLPALRKGGVAWLDVWTSSTAGNPYMRTLVSPVASISENDFAAALRRGLGVEKAEDLLTRNRELLASVQSYIMRTRADLGFGTPPTQRSIGILSTVSVGVGRTEEFETLLKTTVADSLKQANVGNYVVLQVVFGGDPNQYRTVLTFPAMQMHAAAGHPDPLVYLVREQNRIELGNLARQPGSPIAHLERTIIHYVPELSYRPAVPD
jgi:hypothetical protein